MSARPVCLALALAALWAAAPARADSILYRCGPNLCRMAPDGSPRTQLTHDGRPGGPLYSWLSATRDAAAPIHSGNIPASPEEITSEETL